MDKTTPKLVHEVVDNSKLRRLRKKLGLSQEQLASAFEEIGIPVSIATIKRAETGKAVSYRTIKNMAKYYKVELRDLMVASESLSSHINKTPTSESEISVITYKTLQRTKDVSVSGLGPLTKVIDSREETKKENANLQTKLVTVVAFHSSDKILSSYFNHYFFKLNVVGEVEVENCKFALIDNPIGVEPSVFFSTIHDIFEGIKSQSTTIASFIMYVSIEKVVITKNDISLTKEQLLKCITKIRNIPARSLVISEIFKFVYGMGHKYRGLDDNDYELLNFSSVDHHNLKPLIGRDTELTSIKNQIDHSIVKNCYRSIFLHGERSLGKTRLLYEVKNFCDINGIHTRYFDLHSTDIDWWELVKGLLQARDGIQGPKVHAPYVMLVDNVHESNDETLSRLNHISSMAENLPICTVFSSEVSKKVLSANNYLATDETIHLAPLTLKSYYQLSVFDTLDKHSIHQLYDLTQGLPFFLWSKLLDAEKTVPDAAQLAVQNNLNSMSIFTKKAAYYLSISDRPLTVNTLSKLNNIKMLESDFYNTTIFSITKEKEITLTNRIVRYAIINYIIPTERRGLYIKLADVIESEISDFSYEDCGWLAKLNASAGNKLKSASFVFEQAKILLKEGVFSKVEIKISNARDLVKQVYENREELSIDIINDARVLDINMLLTLGHSKQMNLGWSCEDVVNINKDVVKKCGDNKLHYKQKSEALLSLWAYKLSRSNLQMALSYAQELNVLADEIGGKDEKVRALVALSNTGFWCGNHAQAYEFSNEAILLTEQCDVTISTERVMCKMFKLQSLTMLNSPELELELELEVQSTIENTKIEDSSFNLAILYQSLAWHYWHVRDVANTKKYALLLEAISEERSYPFYIGISKIFLGWANYQLTRDKACIDHIVDAHQRWLADKGGALTDTLYATILGGTLIASRQYTLAYSVVSDAIEKAKLTNAMCYISELYVLRSYCSIIDEHNDLEQIVTDKNCSPLQRDLIQKYQKETAEKQHH